MVKIYLTLILSLIFWFANGQQNSKAHISANSSSESANGTTIMIGRNVQNTSSSTLTLKTTESVTPGNEKENEKSLKLINLCSVPSAEGSSLNFDSDWEEKESIVEYYFKVPSAYSENGNPTLTFRLKKTHSKCSGPIETLTMSSVFKPVTAEMTLNASLLLGKGSSTSYFDFGESRSAITYTTLNSNGDENRNVLTRSKNHESIEAEDEEPPQPQQRKTFFFTAEGFIVYENDIYHPNEYCLTSSPSNGENSDEASVAAIFTINLCTPQCSNQQNSNDEERVTNEGSSRTNSKSKTICLNKCCPYGQSLDFYAQRCAPSGPKIWNLRNIYDNSSRNGSLTKLSSMAASEITFHLKIVSYPSNCEASPNATKVPYFNRRVRNKFGGWIPEFKFRVLSNGKFVKWHTKSWVDILVKNTTFQQILCLDGMQNFGEDLLYSGHLNDEILIECDQDLKREEQTIVAKLYGPFHILIRFLSSLFLLITAFIYYLTMKKDKVSVHSWTVLCQIICMFFTYIFLGISHVYSLFPDEHLNKFPCVLTGILSHFFTLSTFFWMTALDFDIWNTFRSTNSCRQSKGNKKLIFYSIFALGNPGIIILVGLILQYNFRYSNTIIVPNYGKFSCFISREALGAYVYYIIGTLLSCNVVLISLTFKNIYKARASTQLVLHQSRTLKQQQSSFKLFSKLVVVMGITWIFEVLSWIFFTQIQQCPTKTRHWIWLLFDTVNYLQPVAIFVIFVCKRKTLHVLATRFVLVRRINPTWANSSKKSNLSTRSSTNLRKSERIKSINHRNGQANSCTTTTTTSSPKSTNSKHSNATNTNKAKFHDTFITLSTHGPLNGKTIPDGTVDENYV